MGALHDLGGDAAGVQGARSLGREPSQCRGILRIAKHVAFAQGLSIGPRKERADIARRGKNEIRRQIPRQTRTHFEAFTGGAGRRGKELAPGAHPVALVHREEERDRSRHAGRAARAHRLQVRQRPALRIQKHVGGRPGGGLLAAVDRRHGAAFCVVVQHEAAAADAGALRLNQSEHRLYRDGGVRGAAAFPQNLDARISRERIGRGDDRDSLGRLRCARELLGLQLRGPRQERKHQPCMP